MRVSVEYRDVTLLAPPRSEMNNGFFVREKMNNLSVTVNILKINIHFLLRHGMITDMRFRRHGLIIQGLPLKN